MIIVIADDLTGAAELGGIALQYKMTVEITTRVVADSNADLLIVATDTRSLSKDEAELVIMEACNNLFKLKPAFIFKKIDSVLRGHVLTEINIQQKIFNQQRALIVAGNPGLGRTIVDGVYLLHGQPVHLSSFSNDPEFPIRSSDVMEMLHANPLACKVLKVDEPMPEKGIIIGELKGPDDINEWCKKIDKNTLVAGAAAFFTAILKHLKIAPSESSISHDEVLQLPALMVCGSTFEKSRDNSNPLAAIGGDIFYLPTEIFLENKVGNDILKNWMGDVKASIQKNNIATIAIHPSLKKHAISALLVRTIMAEAIAQLAVEIEIKEYLIEGGSTAAAVLKALGIDTLYPLQELAPGVIRMGTKENKQLQITLKPGSYSWPSNMFISQQKAEKKALI